ncbi:uncharacterized protein EAE97_010275 [Botrytis byssoidea]|uniref:Uncharacterized protein n=1 Tax=Botrytis byssoidea TaxID=139641 RepID=A0A9P5HYT4_9HELO|nr:uncharacterized protein EAE97_010275 [Botrytis byssoidea]KAF7926766.1 hypothetical protein EAE97_010275 [Botrytis byssoidea]
MKTASKAPETNYTGLNQSACGAETHLRAFCGVGALEPKWFSLGQPKDACEHLSHMQGHTRNMGTYMKVTFQHMVLKYDK